MKSALDKHPALVQPIALRYLAEFGFDCSVEEIYALNVPNHQLVESLGLNWVGADADFTDGLGKLAALDPTAQEDGPASSLLREDLLNEFLCKAGLELCWTFLGEKLVSLKDWKPNDVGYAIISGAFRYTDSGHIGYLNFHHKVPSEDLQS